MPSDPMSTPKSWVSKSLSCGALFGTFMSRSNFGTAVSDGQPNIRRQKLVRFSSTRLGSGILKTNCVFLCAIA